MLARRHRQELVRYAAPRVLVHTVARVIVTLLVVAWPVVVVAGVEEYVGRPVVDVTLVSAGRPLHDPSVLELIETEVGSPLSMREVRESLIHLFSLGTFEHVWVDGSLHAQGVSLRYELLPIGVVARVEFEGDVGVSVEDLREAIVNAYGSTFELNAVESVSETLRKLYRTRGYFDAQVNTQVEGRGSDTLLHVMVEAGARARIVQIFVTGVPPTLYDFTLDRLGFEGGQPYDGAEVDSRLLDYEAELRRQRYYEAELTHDVDIAPGDGVDLRLDIRRGPRITIVFAGDEVPGGDLSELVPIERERSVDEDLLEDADRRIEGFLNALGYRDAVVGHRRETKGDELSIVFTVERGRLYEIDQVVFTGGEAVPLAEFQQLIDLPVGRPLVTRELDAAVASVAEHYSRLGFATVRVDPVISEVAGDGYDESRPVRVTVQIAIVEGVLTRVRSVAFGGNERMTAQDLQAVIRSRADEPYYPQQVAADRDAIRLLYLNAGFERVVVTVEPRFDESLEAVDLTYRVSEGTQIIVKHVLIVGNDAIESAMISREITLREGEPLSLVEVAETRRRLNALALFRRIDIREFSHGGRELRDVVVIVNEAPSTRVSYGGGLEASVRLRRRTDIAGSQAVERLEFAPRGFFQIGRQNLWGKNRSIDLFTRVSLRRKNDPDTGLEVTQGDSFGFNEYRALGTFQESRVLGSSWNGFITGFLEQAIRPGFDLFSRGFTAQLTRQLTPTVTTSVDYGWGQNNTTNKELNAEDEPLVDRLFPEVRLSAFSGSIVRDTRDDPADPRHGDVLSVDTEVAARAIGSEVGFVKTFMQAFVYRELPGVPQLVFAAGVRVGLATAFNRSVDVFSLPSTDPEDISDGVPSSIDVEVGELPLSERFFAGGDTSVRGFALDRLGDETTIDQDGFPQGGNATVILNGELRARVTSTIEIVGFLDGGNVYDRISNMSLSRIRGGAGFGVRYRSPVGPIRVDLGFKIKRQTFDNGELERPTALHISIGQAF